MDRTIAAIATPHGIGGISVIRVSGEKAVEIVNSIFTADITNVKSHTVHYGFIKAKNEFIDEVLVTVMLAPKTFTKEDVVEISTHGGICVTNRVLDAVIRAGADYASPGEFTKRAFVNGRIDLAKAEAVIDIINSENNLSESNAINQLRGVLSNSIEFLRDKLVNLAASMQVAIDYPDEDLEDITIDGILNILQEVKNKIENLINSADDGKIITDGIKTAIIGKPNVGKSAIMNRLSGYDKVIVTDIAGTTRDIIEEKINLFGVPIKLLDTAGIHKTNDTVEKIGVKRSEETIDNSDLIIVVLDCEKGIDEDDNRILEKVKNHKHIIVGNKCDSKIDEDVRKKSQILISAKTGYGIEQLSKIIYEMYKIGEISSKRGEIITNIRHKHALINANAALNRCIDILNQGVPQDIAAIDINSAIDFLGEITGATVSEDIVSAIFSNFCVGK